MEEAKTKGERREAKRANRRKMAVSGRSIGIVYVAAVAKRASKGKKNA